MNPMSYHEGPTPDRTESDTGAPSFASPDATSFVAAARLIRSGEGPDGRSADDVREAEQQQIIQLLREQKIRQISAEEFESLRLLSNHTSEHEVRREADGRVIKRTWAGIFGQIPCIVDGKLTRRLATPFEYLIRQAIQVDVFGSKMKFEGASVSDKPSMVLFQPSGHPSLVISQEFVEAADTWDPSPSEEQISEFLTGLGFEACPGSYFGWFRKSDGVVVLDAKPDNFILSPEGIIPIDLQMAFVDWNPETQLIGFPSKTPLRP